MCPRTPISRASYKVQSELLTAEIRFSYGSSLLVGAEWRQTARIDPGVRLTNSAAKVSAKRARKRSQKVFGAECLRASSRRNGQRDETKFFDARNSAETEMPYSSKPSSPSWGQALNLIDLEPRLAIAGAFLGSA
jgi:hypothetical protein